MKKKSKRFIPNIITLCNMFLGFLAIGLIINQEPLKAGTAIIISSILDVFDGKIARLLGIESEFGMEFDSMADTISFCVVPSVLVYSLYVEGLQPLLGLIISFLPLMFGTIRLARFNINAKNGFNKNYTTGLTTPIAALTLFSFLYFNHAIDESYGDPRTALMLVSALSILMISPIHFIKFPLLSFSSGKSNTIALTLFIISSFGIMWSRGILLFPIAISFICWNIINWLIYNQKNNIRSKTNT